jgi:outer membrane protein assembly factor BamB
LNLKTPFQTPRALLFGAVLLAASLLLTACGGPRESWAGVSSSSEGDTIFVAFESNVTSLKPDKSRNWSYEGDGDARFYAPALISRDHAFVGDYKGRIHAIRLQDGKADWVYEPERTSFLGIFNFGANDRILAPIAIGDDKLFIGNEHGIFALDISREKPEKVWEFDTEHSVWAQPLYVNEPDVIGDPMVYVASLDQRLYAIDAATGKARWSVDLGGALMSQPMLDLDRARLYIGALNSRLYAISLIDGRRIDEFRTEGWIWGSPALHDSKLYFGDMTGRLYELEVTADGFGEDWVMELADDSIRATPIIVDNVLVVASEDKHVYAMNLDDKSIQWKEAVDAPPIADLRWVVQDDETYVVVGTKEKDTLLFALRLRDGEREWSYKYQD